jgi:hypothetical protein
MPRRAVSPSPGELAADAYDAAVDQLNAARSGAGGDSKAEAAVRRVWPADSDRRVALRRVAARLCGLGGVERADAEAMFRPHKPKQLSARNVSAGALAEFDNMSETVRDGMTRQLVVENDFARLTSARARERAAANLGRKFGRRYGGTLYTGTVVAFCALRAKGAEPATRARVAYLALFRYSSADGKLHVDCDLLAEDELGAASEPEQRVLGRLLAWRGEDTLRGLPAGEACVVQLLPQPPHLFFRVLACDRHGFEVCNSALLDLKLSPNADACALFGAAELGEGGEDELDARLEFRNRCALWKRWYGGGTDGLLRNLTSFVFARERRELRRDPFADEARKRSLLHAPLLEALRDACAPELERLEGQDLSEEELARRLKLMVEGMASLLPEGFDLRGGAAEGDEDSDEEEDVGRQGGLPPGTFHSWSKCKRSAFGAKDKAGVEFTFGAKEGGSDARWFEGEPADWLAAEFGEWHHPEDSLYQLARSNLVLPGQLTAMASATGTRVHLRLATSALEPDLRARDERTWVPLRAAERVFFAPRALCDAYAGRRRPRGARRPGASEAYAFHEGAFCMRRSALEFAMARDGDRVLRYESYSALLEKPGDVAGLLAAAVARAEELTDLPEARLAAVELPLVHPFGMFAQRPSRRFLFHHTVADFLALVGDRLVMGDYKTVAEHSNPARRVFSWQNVQQVAHNACLLELALNVKVSFCALLVATRRDKVFLYMFNLDSLRAVMMRRLLRDPLKGGAALLLRSDGAPEADRVYMPASGADDAIVVCRAGGEEQQLDWGETED